MACVSQYEHYYWLGWIVTFCKLCPQSTCNLLDCVLKQTLITCFQTQLKATVTRDVLHIGKRSVASGGFKNKSTVGMMVTGTTVSYAGGWYLSLMERSCCSRTKIAVFLNRSKALWSGVLHTQQKRSVKATTYARWPQVMVVESSWSWTSDAQHRWSFLVLAFCFSLTAVCLTCLAGRRQASIGRECHGFAYRKCYSRF